MASSYVCLPRNAVALFWFFDVVIVDVVPAEHRDER